MIARRGSRVSAAGSGRISMAGLVCRSPGRRTRPIIRMLAHRGCKDEKKGSWEKNFDALAT
ncbi:transposase [Streptomyces iranensis]